MANMTSTVSLTEEAAYTVHALASKASLVKLLHQCPSTVSHTLYNALASKASLVKLLHQCLLIPPKTTQSTLLKAVENNQLPTWPGLTMAAIKQYLPKTSPAMDKGHTKRQRKGLRPTKEKVNPSHSIFSRWMAGQREHAYPSHCLGAPHRSTIQCSIQSKSNCIWNGHDHETKMQSRLATPKREALTPRHCK
jgi:hypothetical protein